MEPVLQRRTTHTHTHTHKNLIIPQYTFFFNSFIKNHTGYFISFYTFGPFLIKSCSY
ncbi:hypothetical protein O3M35_007609 [Rhynocoris fuscipes]|uniref:Uncharacterized protein n=1 Tax=Rhynocoris fuscipes TaxID=488301 RepID=A0AAW1DDM9_9HEMI